MPNYFIRVDGQYVSRGDLLDRLANENYPESFTIEGIVDENNPESASYTFFRIANGYSYSQMQVLFYPALPAAGANQGVDFEHVREQVIEIMDGFGPDADAILNPPQHQAHVNLAADWDDLPGPEPVAPGPAFFDPELGHLPPLAAQQAIGIQNMPAVQQPNFLPPLGPQPAMGPHPPANQNNMNVNNNQYGGKKRRHTQRRRTQRRRTQRRRTANLRRSLNRRK